jgi:hypothetical protein
MFATAAPPLVCLKVYPNRITKCLIDMLHNAACAALIRLVAVTSLESHIREITMVRYRSLAPKSLILDGFALLAPTVADLLPLTFYYLYEVHPAALAW